MAKKTAKKTRTTDPKAPARAARRPRASKSSTPAPRPPVEKVATARTTTKRSTTTQPAAKEGSSIGNQKKERNQKHAAFLERQRQRLLELRDALLDSMSGVARDTLRSRAEGSEASAFGMHQADAGSDAYDRDFAFNLLSQEQDALYEIEEALKRIENGTYGICEMSGKPIPHARLQAIPFARMTVECQSQLEQQRKALARTRQPVTSVFGLTDEESGESEEEEVPKESND